jgi:DNA-binding MarR family transcriptional regulator
MMRRERLLINNWAVAIIIIGNNDQESIVELAKKMDCTYSSLACTTKELERRGIIIRNKDGRRMSLRLSDKGREIFNSLLVIARKTNVMNYQGLVINECGVVAKER